MYENIDDTFEIITSNRKHILQQQDLIFFDVILINIANNVDYIKTANVNQWN